MAGAANATNVEVFNIANATVNRYYVTHHSFTRLSFVECSGVDSRMLYSAKIAIINSTAVHAKSSEQIIGHLGRIVGHNGFTARYMDY